MIDLKRGINKTDQGIGFKKKDFGEANEYKIGVKIFLHMLQLRRN